MSRLDDFQALIADPGDECIVWPYSLRSGYAQLWDGSRPADGHAMACAVANGPRPAGMVAAHNCGVRACINPRHLRWATYAQNTADMTLHGTQMFGESVPWARLTWEQVSEIRRRYAAGGVLQRQLAAEYGVQRECISKVTTGTRWNLGRATYAQEQARSTAA